IGLSSNAMITFSGDIAETDQFVDIAFYLHHSALNNIPKSRKCAFLKVYYGRGGKDVGICYFDNIDEMIEKISFTLSQLGANVKIRQKYEGIQLEDLKREKDK